MKINPLFLIDFYKADHLRQYPIGTTKIYSNFTPRSNKYAYDNSKESLSELTSEFNNLNSAID